MAKTGETIINRCTGERITWLETAADTRGAYLRFRFELAPGGALPVTHIHPDQSETFQMEAGELFLTERGKERRLSGQETATVPAGVPHRWRNASASEAASLLVTFAPALNTETFLEQFFGLANAGRTKPDGTPGFLQIMAMANRYQIFVDGPPLLVQRVMGATLGRAARLFGIRSHYPEYSA